MALAVLRVKTVGHSLAGILGWVSFEFSDGVMKYELEFMSMS